MTRLPGAAAAVVEERKVRRYLLNAAHKEGGPKAAFFFARGFTATDWSKLAAVLAKHPLAHDVVVVRPGAFGDLHEVRCAMDAPDGTQPCIRTVWQVRPDRPPRLITAYPF